MIKDSHSAIQNLVKRRHYRHSTAQRRLTDAILINDNPEELKEPLLAADEESGSIVAPKEGVL